MFLLSFEENCSAQCLRMRLLSSLVLLFCVTGVCFAQENVTKQPSVKVRSNLVMVPVFVNSSHGRPVLDLTVNDFVLTDNGIPQLLTMEEDTDLQPLALAIV